VRQFLVKKISHHREAFFGFGQLEVIPECVRQGLKYNQMRIAPGAQQCPMKHGGIAQQ
jgi:hypothetical protein